LDQEPGEEIIGYVEDTLGMFLVWLDGEEFKTGTRTRGVLGPVLGGPIDLETYEEDIRESIRVILLTSPGERVMRPDFGCGIHDLIFEVANAKTLRLIEERVTCPLVLYHLEVESRDSRALLLVGLVVLTVAVSAGNYDGSLSQMIRS